jgi:hypothetical protein
MALWKVNEKEESGYENGRVPAGVVSMAVVAIRRCGEETSKGRDTVTRYFCSKPTRTRTDRTSFPLEARATCTQPTTPPLSINAMSLQLGIFNIASARLYENRGIRLTMLPRSQSHL